MKKVLLIDDDWDDALFFSGALSELDLSTDFRYFGSGVEALSELLNRNGYHPDVIFMDINLPGINGWECLRELKTSAEFRRIPIVMYSTSDIEREGSMAADVGAAAFMTKPTNFDELKSRLSCLLHELFAFEIAH